MAAGDVIQGVDILVSADGTVIGGQTDATLNLNSKGIDVTHKQSGSWDQGLIGNKNWSVDCDSFLVDSDTAQAALLTAYTNGTAVSCSIAIPGFVATLTGNARVEMKVSAPDGEGGKLAVTFTGLGALS